MKPAADLFRRILLLAAGLAGAAGVASAAAASHAGENRNLSAIAAICLAHGPALLALCASGVDNRLFRIAAALLAAGTLVFSLDLGIREWLGHGAFPGAAPLGGVGMIGGWGLVAIGAFFFR